MMEKATGKLVCNIFCRAFSQSCGTGHQRRASGSVTTPQHQSAAAASHTAAASCAHRRPSMPQTKRTCQQPTFVHQDELWLTQTQRHANRSPPPVTRGLLNNNADSPTDDGNRGVDNLWFINIIDPSSSHNEHRDIHPEDFRIVTI